MKSKHLQFQFMPELDCCYIYDKDGDELGQITRYKKWKCWVFEPRRLSDIEQDIIWSADCLQAVTDKITELNKDFNSTAKDGK